MTAFERKLFLAMAAGLMILGLIGAGGSFLVPYEGASFWYGIILAGVSGFAWALGLLLAIMVWAER